MPFKSEAQRGWMWANDPEMAREWQAHTPKDKKLPYKVKKKKSKEAGDMIDQLAQQAVQFHTNSAVVDQIEKVAGDWGYTGGDFDQIAEHLDLDLVGLTKVAAQHPDVFAQLLVETGIEKQATRAKEKATRTRHSQNRKTDTAAGRTPKPAHTGQSVGKASPTQAAGEAAQNARAAQSRMPSGSLGSLPGTDAAKATSSGTSAATRAGRKATTRAVTGKQVPAGGGWSGSSRLLSRLKGMLGGYGSGLKGRFAGATGKVPGLNRLPLKGRAGVVGGGAAALGLGGLGLGLLGGGGGGAAPSAAPAAAPALAGGAPAASPAAAGGAPAASAGISQPTVRTAGPSVSPGMGSKMLNWAKANKGKAALLGLGGAGLGALGLRRLMAGNDEEEGKYASDKKAALLKQAADVKRHNAQVILSRYLTKAASAPGCTPMLKLAFAAIEQELANGENINTAFKRAFPNMMPERRGVLIHRTVKAAMDGLVKEACGQARYKSFQGSPKDGKKWMSEN